VLPVEEAWYRGLLRHALAIGLAGGVLALLFMGITDAGIGLFFDAEATGWWSGEWWWIPLIALGGLVVALLRRAWVVPGHLPGAIELTREAWIDPATVPRLVALSAVSLVTGASLGPTYGLVLLGGGVASWIFTRLGEDSQEAKHEYALTGVAGGLGAAFGAPLFAAILSSELSPTTKRQYLTAFVPQLIAATVGFVVYLGVSGRTVLDAYEVPAPAFEFVDLFVAVGLGVAAVLILLVFLAVNGVVSSIAAKVHNNLVRGVAGGALIGFLAFAMPLTLTSGSSQLATVIERTPKLGAGFVVLLLGAKMVAVALSLSAGFLGGNVFPMIFIGGTSGVLFHLLIPAIALSLAIATMMAAVPAAFLQAPVALTLLGALTVGFEPRSVASVAVAVVTAYLGVSFLKLWTRRDDGSQRFVRWP
jgi:H+/Cl- antiporter ClcA